MPRFSSSSGNYEIQEKVLHGHGNSYVWRWCITSLLYEYIVRNVWQAKVDKNQYFVILENEFLILKKIF